MIKAIVTEYKGYRFRSRLEARWAVFFDACGVKWEYEPEGFDLGDGFYYLPDFLLHDVWVRNHTKCDLWIEVKGQMTERDAEKIIRFANSGRENDLCEVTKSPILIVTNIPDFDAPFSYIWEETETHRDPRPFNFETIDGDWYAALPCITPQGRFAIIGSDYDYEVDFKATEKAYASARQARFEHR